MKNWLKDRISKSKERVGVDSHVKAPPLETVTTVTQPKNKRQTSQRLTLCSECSSGTSSLSPSLLSSLPRLVDLLKFEAPERTTLGKIFQEGCSVCNFLVPRESRPGNGTFYFDLTRKGEVVELVVKSGSRTETVILETKKENREEEKEEMLGGGIEDWKRIRWWIEECRHRHEGPCRDWDPKSGPSRERYVPRRVIDCSTREVVRSPPNCEYLALSYVWGKDSNQPNDLKSAHRTIQDAMTATLNLGFRFLWVDKYCINQRDEDEVIEQIHQMDEVYKNAVCTLIEAAGTHSDSGLAGLSADRLSVSELLSFQGVELKSTPNPRSGLWTSPWSTRGWTFQEGLFSKRRVFFTNRQVVFDCSARSFFEAKNHPFESFIDGKMNLFERKNDVAIWNGTVDLGMMADLMEQFSKRTLTREDDVIRAFAGVISAFSSGKEPVFHVWGLPYIAATAKIPDDGGNWVEVDPQSLFLSSIQHSLTSNHQNHATEQILFRRKGGSFPSWSWTGWEATSVSFAHRLDTPYRSLPSCKVAFETTMTNKASVGGEPEKKLVTCEELATLLLNHKASIHVSSTIHLTGYTNTIRVNRLWSQAESRRDNARYGLYLDNVEHWRDESGVENEAVHEVMAVWVTQSMDHPECIKLDGLLLCDMGDGTWEKVGTVLYYLYDNFTPEKEKTFMDKINAEVKTLKVR
jgi:hypothetical protein